MTKIQLAITIGIPIIVMANTWLVSIASSHWKNQPPSKRAVISVLAFLTDIIILGFILSAFIMFALLPGLPSRGEIASLVFIGVLLSLHVMFIFFRWIRPRIIV
jgi:hypothetical protein